MPKTDKVRYVLHSEKLTGSWKPEFTLTRALAKLYKHVRTEPGNLGWVEIRGSINALENIDGIIHVETITHEWSDVDEIETLKTHKHVIDWVKQRTNQFIDEGVERRNLRSQKI